MRSTLRIAILMCDELAGNPKKEHGSIGNFYRKFLEAGAQKLEESGLHKRPNIEYFFYDVVIKQEYPNIREIDAVFMTGSRHDSFTSGSNNWILKLVDFTKSLLHEQSRVRIMAVCFGHQIVGRAYGETAERNTLGWEVSVTSVTLSETGKRVFGCDSLALHQMHRDVVRRYPASVKKLGHSDRCEVQGIYVTNRVMTLQGHPEYDATIACELLERRRGSVLDEATYRDGIDRVHHPHDGVLVGAAFLWFLIKE
ncbi:class I glutamine amidotransferase-like protein [Aspergillus costaricaensis CBS 115574]|uniref:Class I glutamine amidotransferase-like protein n=1 Tax=Aspergillus costaricaensis CBS 115574 TaxID=1448317 RepID=A0ACD1HZ39_9EURO|nr:class I glutamine amidotransferase-like protein [Aspergillus costaricaensis CBS 115574]RAK83305.1 class I glutamine amidotransferase-like protein [Aspergillus costaricaensis CBS 115574]